MRTDKTLQSLSGATISYSPIRGIFRVSSPTFRHSDWAEAEVA